MKKNIAKNYVSKIVTAMFCLVMLVYGQCGYAVIEKYLTPIEGSDQYVLGTAQSGVTIKTKELATEILDYLMKNKLREIYIGLMWKDVRWLILSSLAETLQNNKMLGVLNIRGNCIGDKGTILLAKSLLNNTTLTELYLGVNQIRDEGIGVLAEALRNNTVLKILDIAGNDFGEDGARMLAEALQDNTTLTKLYLAGNQIGAEGVMALAMALKTNITLTTLDLQFIDIDDEGTKAIHEALIDNYNMLILKYSFDNGEDEKILLRNYLLVKLLHKIKQASAFTFALSLHQTPLRHVLPDILGFAGFDVHNRPIFENIQNYNNERTRDIIFRGHLEDIIRLFYYGNTYNYREILREINQIRRLQIEIFRENHRDIPQGLMELPENLPMNNLLLVQRGRGQPYNNPIAKIFWTD